MFVYEWCTPPTAPEVLAAATDAEQALADVLTERNALPSDQQAGTLGTGPDPAGSPLWQTLDHEASLRFALLNETRFWRLEFADGRVARLMRIMSDLGMLTPGPAPLYPRPDPNVVRRLTGGEFLFGHAMRVLGLGWSAALPADGGLEAEQLRPAWQALQDNVELRGECMRYAAAWAEMLVWTPGPGPICAHKIGQTQDGWIVTVDEINSSLHQYARGYTSPGRHPGRAAGLARHDVPDWEWDLWVRFLRSAVKRGRGFTTR